jgi:MYXO-CTERM domain-containing protein
MNENTVYQVTIGVYASGLGPATAEVDPTFAVSGGDGTFVYSAGIESASTPEPASWATALIGFGLLTGLRLHQRAKDTSRA